MVWSLAVAVVGGVILRATLLAPEPVPVQAVRAEWGPVESSITNTKAGTIRARRRAKISAEVAARVVEVVHREGDRVEQGAPIILLNDARQKAQLRLAEETLHAAEASRRQSCIARDRAHRELERKRKLAEQAIVSADVLDELDSAYESASASCSAFGAEVEKARAQIGVAQIDLEKMVIRAPFDAVIAEVSVEVGEWITPSPPMITAPSVIDVLDPSSLYVSAPMDEVDSMAIRAGQRATVTVDSHRGVEFPGRVVRVAPYVLDREAQNRTVEIEVEFDNADLAERPLPGTSADVEVVLDARERVLRVPASAVLDGNRVLVALDGRLSERRVEVGLKNWDYAEVSEGLQEGELVVISLDLAGVEDGARVKVEETQYLR